MKWTKLTLRTTVEAEELVSGMLAELGIEGIEIEDKIPLSEEDQKRMFIDILPELEPDDGTADISFYIEPDCDLNERLSAIQEGLEELRTFIDIGEGTITVSETEDKDWINNWKQFFKPFRIDESIWVKPTWEPLAEAKENELVVEIDPGTAFGTGSHETTKLCILNIKKYLKQGDTTLDVGCGSGILSIVAKKLGAAYTLGIDVDENAVGISEENAKINGLSAHSDRTEPERYIKDWNRDGKELDFITGNLIESRELREKAGLEKYDLVVANILADIIIPLSGVIGDCMKQDGIFICSGIIREKENSVLAALCANGFRVTEVTRMGDWVSVVSTKHKTGNHSIECDLTVKG